MRCAVLPALCLLLFACANGDDPPPSSGPGVDPRDVSHDDAGQHDLLVRSFLRWNGTTTEANAHNNTVVPGQHVYDTNNAANRVADRAKLIRDANVIADAMMQPSYVEKVVCSDG